MNRLASLSEIKLLEQPSVSVITGSGMLQNNINRSSFEFFPYQSESARKLNKSKFLQCAFSECNNVLLGMKFDASRADSIE